MEALQEVLDHEEDHPCLVPCGCKNCPALEEPPRAHAAPHVDEAKYPRQCPRWQLCSVARCPLDPLNPMRYIDANDPEKTCKAHLRDRLAIVAKAKTEGVEIPGAGYTRKEEKRLEAGTALEALLAEWDEKAERRRQKGLQLAGARGARTAPVGPERLLGT